MITYKLLDDRKDLERGIRDLLEDNCVEVYGVTATPFVDKITSLWEAGVLNINTAIHKGNIVGYVVFVVDTEMATSVDFMCITSVYISPEYRGVVNVSEFIEDSIEYCREDVSRVMVSLPSNSRAIKLFERMGYSEYDTTLIKEI